MRKSCYSLRTPLNRVGLGLLTLSFAVVAVSRADKKVTE